MYMNTEKINLRSDCFSLADRTIILSKGCAHRSRQPNWYFQLGREATITPTDQSLPVSMSTSLLPFWTNVSWSPSSPPAPPDHFELTGRRKESAIKHSDDWYVSFLSYCAQSYSRLSMFLCSSSSAVGRWLNRLKKHDTSISGNLFLQFSYSFLVCVCEIFRVQGFIQVVGWLINSENRVVTIERIKREAAGGGKSFLSCLLYVFFRVNNTDVI